MNITNKSLIKDLTKIIKARNKQAVNLPSLYEFKGYDEKYITKQQYQELIALDRFIKDNPFIETERIKSVLKQEFKKFKYLQFCNISIEEFVATLKRIEPKNVLLIFHSYMRRARGVKGKFA